MEVTLSEYQRALAALYLRALEHEGPVEFLDFSFGSSEPSRARQLRVARICLPCEGGELWFTGTLGASPRLVTASHEHFFIGIFESADLSLAEFVAAAHHYDLAVEPLDYGHTLPIGNASRLRQAGYSAALVLDAGLYTFFDGVDVSVLGMAASLFSVIPITEAERILKVEGGLDALLEDWDRRGRDVLSVGTWGQPR